VSNAVNKLIMNVIIIVFIVTITWIVQVVRSLAVGWMAGASIYDRSRNLTLCCEIFGIFHGLSIRELQREAKPENFSLLYSEKL
jgi:hypothetical protein